MELDPDLLSDWVGVGCPDDLSGRDDRVVSNVEGHSEDVAQVDFDPDSLEADPACREIFRYAVLIRMIDFCERDDLIRPDSKIFTTLGAFAHDRIAPADRPIRASLGFFGFA